MLQKLQSQKDRKLPTNKNTYSLDKNNKPIISNTVVVVTPELIQQVTDLKTKISNDTTISELNTDIKTLSNLINPLKK
ncbi:MAG: hypothetical protein NTW62_01595 [Candidatus Nomurabacteria bacterium]|nr:hypothetical protein [Candidatus Nomurabacteria bacterium]